MTTYVEDTTTIGTAVIYTSVAANDSVILLQGLTFLNTSTNGVNILHANNSVLNMGTLLSGSAIGLVVNTVNGCEVINAASGTISSLAAAGSISAVTLAGDSNLLNNQGQISSLNGTGVYLSGDQTVIDNSGTILGGAYGIIAVGGSNSITNTGTIQTGATTDSVAVYFDGVGAGKTLFNAGMIRTTAVDSGPAVQVVGHFLTTIVNTGTIQSVGGLAFDAGLATGGIHLTNAGTMIGATAFTNAVAGTALTDTIINTGTINRSVSLGDGEDIFDGIGGTVGGTIFGGDGNDTYRLSDATARVFEDEGAGLFDSIESTVSYSLAGVGEVERLTLLGTATNGTGNTYNNVMFGNGMDNLMLAEGGEDALSGGGGNDTLDGGEGADALSGGTGDDSLLGRSGVDFLFGEDGDDTLAGGAGQDTMDGHAGDDVLHGGLGRDSLTGGADADTFVFTRIAESGVLGTTRDTITDFEAGLDVLDLSGIDAKTGVAGNQAFAWIGSGNFTGVAGQLRFIVSGTAIIVEGTVDADLVADFQVRLNGLGSFLVDDLIL